MQEVIFEKGIKHTAHGLNFYMSYFDDIAKVLPREELCFVVGGWVRDRILGEPVGYNIDVDLLVTCDPTKVAKDFANLIGGTYFEFEKKGFLVKRPTIATVILKIPPYKYRFDFAQIKGKDIEKALIEDLLSRDFTANAMAVSIDDVLSIGAKQTIIYDPAKGIEALQEGKLRPISLKNLEEDPVRILRGFRLAVEKNLELTEDFYHFVKKKGHMLTKVPSERITLELFKILRHNQSAKVIRDLYENGVLEVIFPEFSHMRKIKDQGEHHIYPLDEHTLRVLSALEKVIEERERYLSPDLSKNLGTMQVHGEFSDIELLKLSALFHDIAKPHTFEIRNGKITFYNHDKLGAQIVKEIGRRLKWSDTATEFVSKLVEEHLRPFYLRESLKRGQLTDRGKAKFWKECEEISAHLFLHAIADAIASKDTEEDMQDLIKTIKELETYRKEKYEKIPIKSLLTGREIMEIFRLPEGPKIGEIKRALEQAQLNGIVKTKEDAIKFVKNFISQTQN
ncbi:HD domain-containing protein [Hydrogenobacter hydrogenophilus]|uniref:Poly(A) polymerase n=1 Tax=Hydrogenobacter hydrogenophilus TaxID=35835 RepID=A0A285NWL2_9AQUI|nr:HD domain-containing protein [Hydrogenobacter hydrogenophilus]SNZ12276.1 poly(A) polymerase [Hydrogenobacter hydrogenophilus]